MLVKEASRYHDPAGPAHAATALVAPAFSSAVIVALLAASPAQRGLLLTCDGTRCRISVTAPAPAVVESAPLVVRPGSIIPADIELEPFADAPVPALRRYSYFVSPSNKIVVVDPLERRVVRVLDR